MGRISYKEFLETLEPRPQAGKRCIRCGHNFAPGERLTVRARISKVLAPGAVLLREVCITCDRGMLN